VRNVPILSASPKIRSPACHVLRPLARSAILTPPRVHLVQEGSEPPLWANVKNARQISAPIVTLKLKLAISAPASFSSRTTFVLAAQPSAKLVLTRKPAPSVFLPSH
jgi:hypothetical protein